MTMERAVGEVKIVRETAFDPDQPPLSTPRELCGLTEPSAGKTHIHRCVRFKGHDSAMDTKGIRAHLCSCGERWIGSLSNFTQEY